MYHRNSMLSVSNANPYLFASIGDLITASFPLINIFPDAIDLNPNIASTSSVRWEPTNPPIPKISPFLSSKETFLNDFGNGDVKFSTFRILLLAYYSLLEIC